MSKKIKIPSLNIKDKLSDLFHVFMSNRFHDIQSQRYSDYDEMDDDDALMWLMQQQGFVFRDIYEGDYDYGNYYSDDDDVETVWPIESKRGKGGKKHKHSKHKKGRIIDINTPYSGEESFDVNYSSYEELDSDGIFDGKEIYYYPDYRDKSNRLEFTTLVGFNNFCEENGYVLSDVVLKDIMYRRISHVCLRPSNDCYGSYEIVCEESYGSLFYEVCDSSELSKL